MPDRRPPRSRGFWLAIAVMYAIAALLGAREIDPTPVRWAFGLALAGGAAVTWYGARRWSAMTTTRVAILLPFLAILLSNLLD